MQLFPKDDDDVRSVTTTLTKQLFEETGSPKCNCLLLKPCGKADATPPHTGLATFADAARQESMADDSAVGNNDGTAQFEERISVNDEASVAGATPDAQIFVVNRGIDDSTATDVLTTPGKDSAALSTAPVLVATSRYADAANAALAGSRVAAAVPAPLLLPPDDVRRWFSWRRRNSSSQCCRKDSSENGAVGVEGFQPEDDDKRP
jgi:hypothetical protein